MKKSPEQKDAYIEELENKVTELENRLKSIENDKNSKQMHEDQFTYMVKNSNDMFCIIDHTGKETFISDSVKKITGYDKEELIDHTGFEFLHPDDFPQITEALTYLVQNPGKSYKAEYRHKHKNGGYIHLEAIGTNLIENPLIKGIVMNVRDVTERKAMEKALKDSVELFSKAFYDHPVAMQIVNIKTGEKRDINNSCIKLFDVEIEDFSIGKIFTDNTFTDSKSQKLIIDTINKMGFVNDFPMEIKKSDKEKIQVLVSAYKLDIGDGNLVIASFIDVTEKNTAEKLLKESEEKFRTLVTNTEEIVYIIDKNGEFLLSEGNGLAKIGLKPGEVVGLSVFELFKEYPEIIQKIKNALNGVTNVSEDKVHNIYFRNWYTPQLDEEGNVKGVFGLSIDITEQKNAQEMLRQSEEKYYGIFNESIVPIYILDTAKNFIDANENGINLLGFTKEELFSLKADHVEVDREIVFPEYLKLLNGEKIVNFRQRLRKKNGDIITIINNSTPLINEDGDIHGIQSTVIDITEETKLQEQLVQTLKMESIGRLAGGVAHDFNNMLAVILGYTDLALKQTKSNSVLHNYLLEVSKAANHSAELTRRLLAFARKETISPEIINLNEIVQGMTNMLRRMMAEEIDLKYEEKKGLWNVFMDPSQVDQILINLCINAKDAINGIGEIIIEMENTVIDEEFCKLNKDSIPGEYVLIKVIDNGNGIEEDLLDKIFEPFFTTKTQSEGTGLGLSMIYGIVKQNNGFILVKSSLGEGSIFEIYIPKCNCKETETKIETEIDFKDGGTETILIVEDEEMILELIKEMLEFYGYKVLIANSPEIALEIAEKYSEKIHLLLTDIVMPEMNGQNLSEKLLKKIPDLKILFMSGYTSSIIENKGMVNVEENFLQKPFEEDMLNRKLREILDD